MNEELKIILDKHQQWLNDPNTGERANLTGDYLFRVDLSGANLSGANLTGADLSGADLSGANLSGANLFKVNLSWANLSWANLFGADLSEANLYGACLFGANLTKANLSKTNLSGADLSQANLTFTSVYSFTLGKNFGYYFNGVVKIGCIELPLEQWLKDYKKIGRENNYTEQDIENYGNMLKFLKEIK